MLYLTSVSSVVVPLCLWSISHHSSMRMGLTRTSPLPIHHRWLMPISQPLIQVSILTLRHIYPFPYLRWIPCRLCHRLLYLPPLVDVAWTRLSVCSTILNITLSVMVMGELYLLGSRGRLWMLCGNRHCRPH